MSWYLAVTRLPRGSLGQKCQRFLFPNFLTYSVSTSANANQGIMEILEISCQSWSLLQLEGRTLDEVDVLHIFLQLLSLLHVKLASHYFQCCYIPMCTMIAINLLWNERKVQFVTMFGMYLCLSKGCHCCRGSDSRCDQWIRCCCCCLITSSGNYVMWFHIIRIRLFQVKCYKGTWTWSYSITKIGLCNQVKHCWDGASISEACARRISMSLFLVAHLLGRGSTALKPLQLF